MFGDVHLTFGVIEVLLAVAAVLDLLLSTVLLLNKTRNRSTRFFIVSAYSVTAWVASMFLFMIVQDGVALLYSAKLLYICGILITQTFFLFCLEYLERPGTVQKSFYWWSTILSAVFIALIVLGPSIISGVSYASPESSIQFGPLYPLYMFVLFAFVLGAYGVLLKKLLKFKSEGNTILYRQLAYIIIGTGISIGVSLVGNIVLPYYQNFKFHWLGPVVNSSFVLIMAYAISRYRLFNLRIIATQLFVFSLWITLFVRFVLSVSQSDFILNAVVLSASLVIGVLLVRSVIKEVETREEIQILAQDLKVANNRLTELDKLKSQFLSIATHELRTPLTIVRNFISLMLDGTYGKVAPAVEEVGRQVFERVTDMARSVDTYLNVSKIEQGKISYTFAEADLTHLATLAVEGLKANAEKRGLTLSLTVKPGAEQLKGKFDAPKIAEVLINLIDNSIKYTEKGSVSVTLEKVGNKGVVTIRDTGVGMSDKTKTNLFKLFSPGEDSKRINPASTGVGLYISRAHVEAHKGTLVALSEGAGKGSQFVLELPLT